MSYQAIARKWRPATFEEIAGQGHVTKTLQNALERNRIHHAFLFTGARGVGKTTAARTFARCLNCVEGPTARPCGECASCHETPNGNSTDVVEVDGASNNSVDDVRELRDAVRYLPARDRYRIYIIDEVHMLSIGAFNALLKTLEEPPPHVIFIFATTEPQKIPDTILSRVQRFDFKRIPTTTVVKRLALIATSEGVSIPEDGLKLIARAGEGSMRDAQSLLDQVIAFGEGEMSVAQVAELLGMVDRSLLYGFLEGLVHQRPEQCLDVIAQVYDYGYEIAQLTTELLELLRNAALMVLSESSRKHIDAPEDELGRLADICEGIDAETFSRWFAVMLKVHDEVSRSNRPRLVLEMALARLIAVRPLRPVDHLVGRLEKLEQRLRQEGVRPQRKSLSAMATPAYTPPTRRPPPPSPTRVVQPPAARPQELVEPTPEPTRPTEPTPEPPRQVEPRREEARREEPRREEPRLDQRLEQLIRDLPGDLARLRPVLEHAAFLGVDGKVLRLGSPGQTHLDKARRIADEPTLIEAARKAFGTQRIEFRLREGEQAVTNREHRQARIDAWRKQLWDQAEADPGVQTVISVLGGQLRSVEPTTELPDDA